MGIAIHDQCADGQKNYFEWHTKVELRWSHKSVFKGNNTAYRSLDHPHDTIAMNEIADEKNEQDEDHVRWWIHCVLTKIISSHRHRRKARSCLTMAEPS